MYCQVSLCFNVNSRIDLFVCYHLKSFLKIDHCFNVNCEIDYLSAILSSSYF